MKRQKSMDLKIDRIEQIIIHTALAHFVESGKAEAMEKPGEGRISLFAYKGLSERIINKICLNLGAEQREGGK